jgi:hypothetical protein
MSLGAARSPRIDSPRKNAGRSPLSPPSSPPPLPVRRRERLSYKKEDKIKHAPDSSSAAGAFGAAGGVGDTGDVAVAPAGGGAVVMRRREV